MTVEARVERLARQVLDRPGRSPTAVPTPANVLEFVTDPRYLGQRLYPRQAALLKLMTCSLELFTEYDTRVIVEWGQPRRDVIDGDVGRWVGTSGIAGDIYERLDWCRGEGRPWFNEIVLALGRRSGKSFLGAVLTAWRLYQLLQLEDPGAHYGLPPEKLLNVLVFSGSADRAARDQFRDLKTMITGAQCFAPHLIGEPTSRYIRLASGQNSTQAGRPDIQVEAVQTTGLSARGPATLMVVLDEAAHLVGAGGTSSADELYTAAQPSTVQFGTDALMWLASSPSSMTGKFYERFLRGMTFDPVTLEPTDPQIFAAQFASWELYRDWEIAHELAMWPDGPTFAPLSRAIVTYDDTIRRMEHANPEYVATEFRAQWRTGQDAYFRPDTVEAVFGPFNGRTPTNGAAPEGQRVYVAHGDPSISGCNFGFAVGHLETVGGDKHVVFDLLTAFRPEDFPDHRIDYRLVIDEIVQWARRYRLRRLSFDTFNMPAVEHDLRDRLKAAGLTTIVTFTQPTAPSNWAMYEKLKTAAAEGRVHAPLFPLAQDEWAFAQLKTTRVDHPTSGPVQTKDVLDCMAAVALHLLDDRSEEIIAQLRALKLSASAAGGFHLRQRGIGADNA